MVNLTKQYKRVIQLELNEISKPVIDQLVAGGDLPNFAKINREWTFLKTHSEQEYEHLEPWIQWITAHTGKTFAEHGIFRLSDVNKLSHPQIWETFSEQGIESAIIGSMNAVKGTAKGGFFFPDPWAKQGKTYPVTLQPLWDLISKKVQGHAADPVGLQDLVKGLSACLKFQLPFSLYLSIVQQLIRQQMDAKSKWRLVGIFDQFLFAIFQKVLATTEFGFYTLFLNSIAHYQHHYWRNFDRTGFNPDIRYHDCHETDDPMSFGYKNYDDILGKLLPLADDPNTLIIIVSGLSQVPYLEHEKLGGMNYYRLRNHAKFIKQLGLNELVVHPMMSRDWQVSCDNTAALTKAQTILAGLMINDDALFRVVKNDGTTLFIETAITRGIKSGENIQDKNGHHIADFHHTFINTAIKSGHHVGEGCLWLSQCHNNGEKNKSIPLTKLYQLNIDALGLE